jgi:hypothetical protein
MSMKNILNISLVAVALALFVFIVIRITPPRDFKVNSITFKGSGYTEQNQTRLINAVNYFEANTRTCARKVTVKFTNVPSFTWCTKGVTAVGCNTWNPDGTADIEVAIKNRTHCQITIIIMHELMHACLGAVDCYNTWNTCWAREIEEARDLICYEINNLNRGDENEE